MFRISLCARNSANERSPTCSIGMPEGFAGSGIVLLTLRSPAAWGFTRTVAACGLPELLLMAGLLLVEAGSEPDGALGAGGGMPAADFCRDCAAAAAAAALARWASASSAAC